MLKVRDSLRLEDCLAGWKHLLCAGHLLGTAAYPPHFEVCGGRVFTSTLWFRKPRPEFLQVQRPLERGPSRALTCPTLSLIHFPSPTDTYAPATAG